MASTLSALMGKIEGIGNLVAAKGKALLDGVFPPEKRAEVLTRLQQFAIKNPKLSAFLLSNIVLTGPPLFLFILFTITVLVFSIVVALLVGLLVAVAFTLFCVGVALLVILPTVFFTTLVACFLFLWGMGGYFLLKWFNKGEVPAPEGSAIGDKINSLTGGRMDWIMGPARDQEEKQANGHREEGKTGKASNGTPTKGAASGADIKKGADGIKRNVQNAPANVGNATNKATKPVNGGVDTVTKSTGLSNGVTDGVTKNVTDVNGLKNKTGTATGALKGTAGGATGVF